MMSNVLTSNENKAALTKLVKTLQPDVLVLLEIDDDWVKSLKVLDSIYPHTKLLPSGDNFGIGILSRYPLKTVQVLRFVSPLVPSITADIELNNSVIHIVATHPLPPVSTIFFEGRNLHYKRLAEYVTSINGSKLVIGDFNTTMFSPWYEKFIADSGLKSASQAFGIQPTWMTFLPIFRIQLDYAFVDPMTRVKHFEVLPSVGSDHFPIFCELIVEAERQTASPAVKAPDIVNTAESAQPVMKPVTKPTTFLSPIAKLTTFLSPIATAASTQIGKTTIYDPAYVGLSYPGGDLPLERGVCTDVVIRALRAALNMDLQQLVHEDMEASFNEYPKIWGLKRTDKNIDHRRVPNLMTYFERKGWSLGVTKSPGDYLIGNYLPGDLITCIVGGSLPHIMVVSNKKNSKGTPLIIHNIGGGTLEEDRIFEFPITGHYRIRENP
jgi:hypothetical protein